MGIPHVQTPRSDCGALVESWSSRERRVEFNDGMDELPRDLVAGSSRENPGNPT